MRRRAKKCSLKFGRASNIESLSVSLRVMTALSEGRS